jgi:pSer/pThr/pTyr-binding forkhead associated (FHA) protein
MQARLKVVQDNANLKQVKLLPTTVIGRGAECHLKIASTQVSRKHCRITVTDNEVLIEDLTSSNGTFVDQQKIASGKLIVVAPGAKLQIGPATFIVDYTPPVNLETMPTTVIKASELQALNQMEISARGSETSIPTIDPFAAAVSAGTAPTGRITPNPAPEVPAPERAEKLVSEPPPNVASPVDEPELTLSEPVMISDPKAMLESTVTEQLPPLAPPVGGPIAVSAPVPTPETPFIEFQQPSPPPLMAAPVAAAIPGASAAPVTPPQAAEPKSDFDFLGGAATAAAEPAAFDAFQFHPDSAAPASLPAPSLNTSKPVAAKKPLFGLFGKKDKNAAQPAASPAPILPASESAETIAAGDTFPFAPPESPAPHEAATPPAASDDPFAFLK